MMTEIPGFDGNYLVDRDGKVCRKIFYKHKKFKLREKKASFSNGYLVIGLVKDKKNRSIGVHRLVAMTFIPNPDNKPQVNHKNGNKSDNRVGNLEWVTSSENALHAHRTGLIKNDARFCNPKVVPFIIAKVCDHLGIHDINRVNLYTDCRQDIYAKARQIVMFHLIAEQNFTLEKAGGVFNRDHATASYAVRAVKSTRIDLYKSIFGEYPHIVSAD